MHHQSMKELKTGKTLEHFQLSTQKLRDTKDLKSDAQEIREQTDN